ncbi:right-handed parallel beta-helix repeat-containing protein [Klebsiella quasipneumoniae]|uniref:right-handed parallel beta-helix repeat-containing protein n=1 Tax=Klebsiella TaxID=570 RepID=UPI00032F9A00|nr:right-handed parallel beta-helix repeat-containing protein [Klebsiella sp. KTE92]EOQ52180.1 hypothetical protein A1WC_03354 [Klebsiella sp. KTE92]HBR1262996.1 right-handed parallel beta-helix repeat-containing protein [Klebsiella quasipneumoniae subsp. quasipneumoniae]HEM3760169.1 right-handed parallel beta-helix repeat-containing protein [Klebsiella quasipneumoniae]
MKRRIFIKNLFFLSTASFVLNSVYINRVHSAIVRGIGYNRVCNPEMFGAVGDGVNDDSAAMEQCFRSKCDSIVFRRGAKYVWKNKVTITGKVSVDATDAEIICDGVFLEVIDGAGSDWNGGILSTFTTPYTIMYDDDWNILEKGQIGHGRLPFNDEHRVDDEYKQQRLGCCLLFTSSDETPQKGLKVNGLKSTCGALVIAGYTDVNIHDCYMRGGGHIACISIINGSREALLWGYDNDDLDISAFEFARGYNHKVSNCYLYECANNGLYITGSDCVIVDGCNFVNNGESGLKTGQYVKRWWTSDNRCCTNVSISNCSATGQYYDGFDLQNAFGSGSKNLKNSYLTCKNNISTKNRRTGFISQGGGNLFVNCYAEDNGIHGMLSNQSKSVKMIGCVMKNNCRIFNGIEIGICGPDSTMESCIITHTNNERKVLLISHTIGDQEVSNFYGKSIRNNFSDINKCFFDPRVTIIDE